jgi:hypothetical protein
MEGVAPTRRGRPGRTDRSYALPGLIHCIAATLSRNRTSRRGELTPKGFRALGEVPAAWVKTMGPDWCVVGRDHARRALTILKVEFARENGL